MINTQSQAAMLLEWVKKTRQTPYMLNLVCPVFRAFWIDFEMVGSHDGPPRIADIMPGISCSFLNLEAYGAGGKFPYITKVYQMNNNLS